MAKVKEMISKGPEVDARAYGTAGSQAAIIAALADIGSKQKILVLYPSLADTSTTWSLTADQIIPANVTLKVSRGAILSVATTKTLTINGSVVAGDYQIFSCAGTGKVRFGTSGTYPWSLEISEARAAWWGVVSTAANNATALNAAIDACIASRVGKLLLPSGDFHITASAQKPPFSFGGSSLPDRCFAHCFAPRQVLAPFSHGVSRARLGRRGCHQEEAPRRPVIST